MRTVLYVEFIPVEEAFKWCSKVAQVLVDILSLPWDFIEEYVIGSAYMRRWYGVRKEAHKLLQQREVLRSRLQMHLLHLWVFTRPLK